MTTTVTDEERTWAKHRAQYLKRTTDLGPKEAQTVAWSELGFSQSGISKRVDATADTVEKYCGRIVAQYGLVALDTKGQHAHDADLDEPTAEDIRDLAPAVRESWFEAVDSHPDVAPEWVRVATLEDRLEPTVEYTVNDFECPECGSVFGATDIVWDDIDVPGTATGLLPGKSYVGELAAEFNGTDVAIECSGSDCSASIETVLQPADW